MELAFRGGATTLLQILFYKTNKKQGPKQHPARRFNMLTFYIRTYKRNCDHVRDPERKVKQIGNRKNLITFNWLTTVDLFSFVTPTKKMQQGKCDLENKLVCTMKRSE